MPASSPHSCTYPGGSRSASAHSRAGWHRGQPGPPPPCSMTSLWHLEPCRAAVSPAQAGGRCCAVCAAPLPALSVLPSPQRQFVLCRTQQGLGGNEMHPSLPQRETRAASRPQLPPHRSKDQLSQTWPLPPPRAPGMCPCRYPAAKQWRQLNTTAVLSLHPFWGKLPGTEKAGTTRDMSSALSLAHK